MVQTAENIFIFVLLYLSNDQEITRMTVSDDQCNETFIGYLPFVRDILHDYD